MKLINIHTHSLLSDVAVVSINNRYHHFGNLEAGLFSLGLHPWYLNENTIETEWAELQAVAESNNVVAIGECGLDRVCATDWDVQLKWFEKQIVFANEINKPLIIHCVRAFNEVIHLLEAANNKVPVIFHGFNKKREVAELLVQKGYYLSFGKSILQDEKSDVLKWIPADRFFLENDDSHISIEKVYTQAAHIRGLSLEEVKNQIWANAQVVFGKKIEEWKI